MPFTPRQMFELVADVERYPEFLPLCESLVVKSRDTSGPHEVLIATMGIGYKAIRERFTTRVTLKPENAAILVEYLDGPFKRLENRWHFAERPGGTEVDFFIDYEFRSVAPGLVMGAMFDTAFRRFAQAFEDRARAVYGREESGRPTSA